MRLGSGDQLWKSDGTAENTKIVATLSHSIYEMVLLENNNAIFTLNGGDNGDDIWTSNGTEAGTAVLKDLNYFLKTLLILSLNGKTQLMFWPMIKTICSLLKPMAPRPAPLRWLSTPLQQAEAVNSSCL
ncbi:MAG: hypothetical protein IPP37_20910 [Saprospiraceae bacterium]|nr:hypothetical protein [Saprospiraceae bacterium]